MKLNFQIQYLYQVLTISPEKEIEFIAQALNFETSTIPSGITVNEFLGKTYVILNCIETDDFYYVEAYNKNGTQKCTFKLDEAGQEIIDKYYDDNEYIDKNYQYYQLHIQFLNIYKQIRL